MKVPFCITALAAFLVGPMLLGAPDKEPGPRQSAPGTTVIKVVSQPAVPSGPAVSIALHDRHGHATPVRQGFNHTGGGNTDIAQPAPDIAIFTMTGVAVAGAHPVKSSVAAFSHDLNQCFEVVFEKPEVKTAKLTLEGRVIGLLRSHGHGVAEENGGCATVSCGEASLLTLSVPAHAVTRGENLSINDHTGPVSVPVKAGKFTLHQVFQLSASHPRCLMPHKAASAEFAPDPALEPLWISYWEPFHGVIKKDFGFQVVMKVAVEEETKGEGNNGDKRDPEKLNNLPKLVP